MSFNKKQNYNVMNNNDYCDLPWQTLIITHYYSSTKGNGVYMEI